MRGLFWILAVRDAAHVKLTHKWRIYAEYLFVVMTVRLAVCRYFGHRWIVIEYSPTMAEFLGCARDNKCSRCGREQALARWFEENKKP